MSEYSSVIEAWGAPEYARVYMSNNVEVLAASTSDSLLQLLGLLILFAVILAAAYYVSKWIGKNGGGVVNQCNNISIVETFRIAPNKYIQIVKIADKYYALGIGKDSIEKIGEIDEEELNLEKKQLEIKSFSEIYSMVRKKVVRVDDNDENNGQEKDTKKD